MLSKIHQWCFAAADDVDLKRSPLYLASEKGDLEGVRALCECSPELLVSESKYVRRCMQGSVQERVNKREAQDVRVGYVVFSDE